jgi:hypothetical protein
MRAGHVPLGLASVRDGFAAQILAQGEITEAGVRAELADTLR